MYGAFGDAIVGILLTAGASAACFTGDTQIMTRRGYVRFDQLTRQDEVLSGPEEDPRALPRYREVEAVFRTIARIWHLHVRGQVIRTTAEHPFYAWGKGWGVARELQPGDVLRSDDGQLIAVEEVCDGGYEEVVYNCSVSQFSTYFVGGEDWGFSVWAHNTCDGLHHYVPRFMGSLVPRGSSLLTWFRQIGHTQIHRALNRFLQPLGMAPSATNSGLAIQGAFTRAERLTALVNFYRTYQGGAHYQAFLTEMRNTLRAGSFR